MATAHIQVEHPQIGYLAGLRTLVCTPMCTRMRAFVCAALRSAALNSPASTSSASRRSRRAGTQTFATGIAAGLVAILLSGVLGANYSEAATTYYRWKDTQGKLVVSDRPPEDLSIEYDVVSQGTSLIRRVQPGKGAVPPEVNPRPGNEFEQVDSRQARFEAPEKNPERCKQARDNLETLNGYARINIRDEETGELRYISEEEKDVQRRKAQDIIRVHC